MSKSKWSQEDDLFLIDNYKNISTEEISKILDKNIQSIHTRASKLKIKKSIMSHDEYCEYIKNNSQIIVEGGYYSGMACILEFRCLIHNYIWSSVARSVYRTLRCPRCHLNKKRIHEDFVKDVFDISPNIKIVGTFSGVHNYIDVLCTIHNYRWSANAEKLLQGRGCPICSESHGERTIGKFLIKNKINFDKQKRFSDCISAKFRMLVFDFCVYDDTKNIFCLIEFQGRQHFMSVDFFGGEDGFMMRQMYDIYKKYYCHKRNIKLIIVDYIDFDDIENILSKELEPLLKGGR